jgi:hypothetical protein
MFAAAHRAAAAACVVQLHRLGSRTVVQQGLVAVPKAARCCCLPMQEGTHLGPSMNFFIYLHVSTHTIWSSSKADVMVQL